LDSESATQVLLTRFPASGILASAARMAFATLKRDPRFSWFWRIISPAVAIYMFVNAQLTLLTSVISLQGPGAHYPGPAVYVNWHKYVSFLCIHHAKHHRWLLMSSAPYMAPVALWCRWMGLTVIRSAPGERSRESLVHLVNALKNGNAVVLAADGPAGPAFCVKPGCVDLALATGVPVIPVAYRSTRGRSNLKRWDQLYQVRKFDRIEVRYGAPIFLDPTATPAASLERVRKGLEEFS
jgi:lysophospholipid acyltransferase (LPLAT)-like uncharacterized protein